VTRATADLARRKPDSSPGAPQLLREDAESERAPDDGRAGRTPTVARSTGAPLDADVRAGMEARLGHDFGHVRVHADAPAAAGALSIGAAAYTAGSDVVFAPGAYAPRTPGGARLLAHELTHVAQQSGAATGGGRRTIDPPTSAAEREADAASQAVADGRPAAPVRARHASPVVSRSLFGGLLGAGIGATIGAIGGALLGGLLGPAGAVIGGIVGGVAGLIGGAIVGDLASRQSRKLTDDEKKYAKEIYHDSVDFDAITITRNSIAATGAARTIGNTINLEPSHFVGDTMELSPAGMLTLIHEMGHVWQYQNGGLAYIPSSLIPQIVAGVTGQSRNVAYDWRAAIRAKIPWENWNAEQQAECISDYNEALRRIEGGDPELADYETVTLAEPYIERVRRREGAPGSKRRAGATPEGDAGAGP